MVASKTSLHQFLANFSLGPTDLSSTKGSTRPTRVETVTVGEIPVPQYINEFWTSKQRQALPLHEISYRACFKPQLARFFVNLLSQPGDIVYDPFGGRGTTALEAALLGREVILNDISPLSQILSSPRFFVPRLADIKRRLEEIPMDHSLHTDIDLSMFYHPNTEAEIISLKRYLQQRKGSEIEDKIDRWVRMVATNRLTGHSPGFFSVYTLPPNQAVSPASQRKINAKRHQKPTYRDILPRILKKSRALQRGLSDDQRLQLKEIGSRGQFLTQDARHTPMIKASSVQLIVTSPPFLNVVQYADDNWLRCWFNSLDTSVIASKITATSSLSSWTKIMGQAFHEFYRVLAPSGWIAFEVGEIRHGKLKLEEEILPLGLSVGLTPQAIVINQQKFTKTSNIWGVDNNRKGTNSNRIVLFQKQ